MVYSISVTGVHLTQYQSINLLIDKSENSTVILLLDILVENDINIVVYPKQIPYDPLLIYFF